MPWIKRNSSAFSLDCTPRACPVCLPSFEAFAGLVVGDRRPRLWSLRHMAFGEMFSLTALCLPIILFDVCFVYRAGFFLKMHKPRKAKLGFSHVRLVAAAVT
jgi:hypothetical protein